MVDEEDESEADFPSHSYDDYPLLVTKGSTDGAAVRTDSSSRGVQSLPSHAHTCRVMRISAWEGIRIHCMSSFFFHSSPLQLYIPSRH